VGGVFGGGPKAPDVPKLPPAPVKALPKVTDNSAAIAAQAQAARYRRRSTSLATAEAIALEPNKARKTALGM
jgi:hypothetical protein